MSEFRFAEPELVHLLWGVVAFVALLLWLDRRGGSALERLVGPALQARLVRRASSGRRALRIALLGLAAACAVLALMRPQWGLRTVAASRVGAKIMIALDVSRSMLAEDVAPNRLERAKAEVVDLLDYLDGDQVGLIAFAGRASVLSPLTPDFGFLRLVLDQAGPGSVRRGGTKLAEPIRKAVAGFGPSDGASRAILLITDGEDHDSFAVDAAREAAEAGIRIIAIGFGDEAGAEIRITDPRTGARGALRDADGRPVVSRLNGALLRDLALETGGAYVPAGTGVLDLESIYDRHISRLTRGELAGRRTVRDEGYPWFVLLSLIFVVSSATVSGGRLRSAALSLAFSIAAAGGPTSADAQAVDPSAPPAPQAETPVETSAEPEPASGGEEIEDPRSLYNRGVEALEAREYDDAERWLSRARDLAGGDDELRFRAAYDLGWVAVQQAGRKRGEAPREALAGLHRAAEWFREALQHRPDDEDTRANLEVTLLRALALADDLAAEGEDGVEGVLAELAERERRLVAEVTGLVEAQVAQLGDPSAYVSETLRGEFRARAVLQRAILSDTDQLASRAAEESDALAARPEEERSPEDAMRRAQLDASLEHLHRARERMGQSRRELRRRQADRAHRRASAALRSLERARDQFRDPVAVLDELLRDGSALARKVALLGAAERAIPGLAAPPPPLPPWLTVEIAAEDQSSLALRTGELEARLRAGLDAQPSGDESSPPEPPRPPEQAELLAAVREATPLVSVGRQQFETAAGVLEDGSASEAAAPQREALLALSEARERFLDLRGLIEATHQGETGIATVLGVGEQAGGTRDAAALAEYLPSLLAAQDRNLGRGERLEVRLEAEVAKVRGYAMGAPGAAAPGDAGGPDREAAEAELQRLDAATQILTLALANMDGVRASLGGAPAGEATPGDADFGRARKRAGEALGHLETLRRLFFTIVEHVRELARGQLALADRTEEALGLAVVPDADPERHAAPLVAPQGELAERALAIATALEQQSNDASAAAPDEEQAEETSRRLRQAGEHVLLAQGEMETAAQSLDDPAEIAPARAAQDHALEKLAQALALLEPPQEEGEAGEDGRQQEGEQQPQPGEGGEEEAPQQRTRAVDPAQLLQEVRDREAQRRRDRAQRSAGYETVEKDW